MAVVEAAKMDPLDELRRAWDHTHKTEPTSASPDSGLVTFAGRLQGQLPPGSPVLDAGCGRGRNTFYLSRLGFTIYACDLSRVAVTLAQGRAGQDDLNASFLVADLADLPYADNAFAAVICVHVLPYNYKAGIIQGAGELRRVLQPGGWLYFDLLGCDDAEYGNGQQLEEHTFLDSGGMPVHFTSQQELDALLHGLIVKRLERFELGAPERPRRGWTVWTMK